MVSNPFFSADQQRCRWSYFKNLTNSEEMLRIVRDEALPFIKTSGVSTAEIEARDSLSEDHAGASEAFTLILANPLLLPYKFDPSFCKTA